MNGKKHDLTDGLNFPIDMVYLWVNGKDPAWRLKRAALTGEEIHDSGLDCEGRYSDNDELRHSLRAVELYAPWIRKIFIVTDNQVPSWLDTDNPKIEIIDHTQILPPEALPTFNSTVIEHRLFRIPGLADHFLYSNDDMFFNRKVSPRDFFTENGQPIIRLNRRWFRKLWLRHREKSNSHPLDNYNRTIHKSALMVEREFGKYIGHKPHHKIEAYRKEDYEDTYNRFREDIEPVLSNHLRADSDIQRTLYSFAPIAQKRAKVKYVTEKTSFRCHIDKPHYFQRLEKKKPMLFCMNDSQYATDLNRKMVKEYLERRFPVKSQFEK